MSLSGMTFTRAEKEGRALTAIARLSVTAREQKDLSTREQA